MAVSFIHSSFKLYVPLNGMLWLAKWLQRERERGPEPDPVRLSSEPPGFTESNETEK